jgi:hypothetical protein
LILLAGTCFGTRGDREFPSNGNKLIWPAGEMVLDDFGDGSPKMTLVDTPLNNMVLRPSFISLLDGNFQIDALSNGADIKSFNGFLAFSIGNRLPRIDIERTGITLNSLTNNIILETQGATIEVIGDLDVTGTIFNDALGTGSSLKLSGSSANELLVVAAFTDVVQESDGSPFQLRITGNFTDGSDADYVIEIDGTNPDTYKWSKDTIEQATGVAAPFTFTTLDAGIRIAFLDSGSDVFVLGDQWSFTAVANPAVILNVDTQTPLVTIDALIVTTTTILGGNLAMGGNDITAAGDIDADSLDVDALVVNTSTDFNGVNLTNTGNVIPSASSKQLGSGTFNWVGIFLDGTIGIPAVNHTLDFNIGTSFDFLMGNSTDVVLNFDGSGVNRGKYTYESDNDLSIFDHDMQLDAGLTVDTTTLVVEPITHRVGIGTASPEHELTIHTIANAMSGANIDVSNLTVDLHNLGNDNGEGIGIGFGITDGPAAVGAAIVHERVGAASYGNLHFATKPSGGGADIPIRVTILHDGNLGIGEIAPENLLEMTSTEPYITLHNSTVEDGDGGRESRLNFKGHQTTASAESTLARIEVSHDGAADDEKGKMVFSVNTGALGDTPATALTIDSGADVAIINSLTVNTTDLVVDAVTHRVEIGSADGSDKIQIFHDTSNVFIKWTKGQFIFQTDEGTNTETILILNGKGTGAARIQMEGQTIFRVLDSPTTLSLVPFAGINIGMFEAATDAETPEVHIHGFPTGLSNKFGSFQIVDIGSAEWFQIGTDGAGVSIPEITRIGDGGTTDYSEFEADGTLEFNGAATVWADYVTPLSRALFGGAANDPTLTKVADDGAGSAGVWAFVFGDGDEVLATVQLPHSWKEGSTIYPHIHFFTMTDVDPSDNFDMDFEYWWADQGEDFPANTTLVTTTHATGVNSQYLHQLGNLTVAGIDGTGHTISSVLMIRIGREASVGDNYAGGVAILDFDVHYEKDTIGSRGIISK